MGWGLKFVGRAGLGATTALAATLLLGAAVPDRAQAAACSGDAGGITVSPGFCASVFADHLGHPRHMVVGANGVLYVNTWSGRYYHNDAVPAGGFLIALQDTSGSGHADKIERFGPGEADGDHGGTGVAIYHDHLYAETNDRIVRYALPRNGGTPSGAAETVVSGLPLTGDHPMHPFQIDANGHLYVDLGSATNACQSQNRMPNVPGINPCTELETRAGTWEYDANKLNQKFSPKERFATGLRNGEGFAFDSAGHVFATQHGRDQLYENFSKYYTAEQGQNEPAEEVVQERRGSDFGWPECYYDLQQKKLVLAPEYGGDGGKTVGVCAQKQEPVAAFPAHWAPNDLLIYKGNQFPAAYKDGVFIAFHGSWNRAPGPQGGYNVVFQPVANGKASAPFVVFADGFAGAVKGPSEAVHRPTGLAVGPDGALYIADDKGGRIWRVTYQGGSKSTGIAAAAPAPVSQLAAGKVLPPEGIHPDAGAPLPVPPGGSPEQVALGERIFHGQAGGGTCSGCHGSDAKGSMTGSNLVEGRFLWSDGSVAGIIKTIDSGVAQPKEHTGAMPPKGGAQLSQTDVTAVADYVWAISHPAGH
jgi:glucose/arabinose dehydrogenase